MWGRFQKPHFGPSSHAFFHVTRNEEMTCRSHKGENHADCQNFTMHWVCLIHGYESEKYSFKFGLTLQAELNVYLFQNGKDEPLSFVSILEYLKLFQINVLNI